MIEINIPADLEQLHKIVSENNMDYSICERSENTLFVITTTNKETTSELIDLDTKEVISSKKVGEIVVYDNNKLYFCDKEGYICSHSKDGTKKEQKFDCDYDDLVSIDVADGYFSWSTQFDRENTSIHVYKDGNLICDKIIRGKPFDHIICKVNNEVHLTVLFEDSIFVYNLDTDKLTILDNERKIDEDETLCNCIIGGDIPYLLYEGVNSYIFTLKSLLEEETPEPLIVITNNTEEYWTGKMDSKLLYIPYRTENCHGVDEYNLGRFNFPTRTKSARNCNSK